MKARTVARGKTRKVRRIVNWHIVKWRIVNWHIVNSYHLPVAQSPELRFINSILGLALLTVMNYPGWG